MKPEERRDFEAKCHQEFGYSSKHMKYLIADISERLDKVEKHTNHSNDIISAMIVRVEGIVGALAHHFKDKDNFLKRIESESETIYKNSSKNKLIEKR